MDLKKEFGHNTLSEFLLDDRFVYLNHGGFGATPRVVDAEACRFRDRMERDPTYFYQFDLYDLLREGAQNVANFLGGAADDWVCVENATAGVNAVIKSSSWLDPGEVMHTSLIYPAIKNTINYYSSRLNYRVIEVPIAVPFLKTDELLEAVDCAISPKTKLAVFEHITSFGGIVLPVKELAALCKAKNVAILIDGAHAPGQIPVNVADLNVDYYVGNLHKWAFAPKSVGVLWCAPHRQAGLHSLSISNFYGQGYQKEFGYSGTRDNSAWLSTGSALRFMDSYGKMNIMDHNSQLLERGSRHIASIWHSRLSADDAYLASMASIHVPWIKNTHNDSARNLVKWFRDKKSIVVSVAPLGEELWLRISAQIYNEFFDYEKLASAAIDLKNYPNL